MSPPGYFYAFYHASDRRAYVLLEKIRHGKKIEVVFGQDDLNEFFRRAIVSSKATDWRKFLVVIVDGLKSGKLDLGKVREKPLVIKKGYPVWAYYRQDKELCELVDRLAGKKFAVRATKRDVLEFVLRFVQTELIHDWRGPKLAILYFAKNRKVDLKKLNSVLRIWDFTGLVKGI